MSFKAFVLSALVTVALAAPAAPPATAGHPASACPPAPPSNPAAPSFPGSPSLPGPPTPPSKPSVADQVLSVDTALVTSNCSLENVSMNLGNAALPQPPCGQKLLHVAVGRGIQNYTCASTSAAPAAQGAVATLYNAACLAADQSAIFDLVPDIVLQFSLPTEPSEPSDPPSADGVLSNFNTNLLGHHFFLNTTTPAFNLNTPSTEFGMVVAKKVNSTNAPADSPAGQASNANGAVPWLFLETESTTTGNVLSVYRTHTVGGNPPATCSGLPAAFSVEYAAKYWFWG